MNSCALAGPATAASAAVAHAGARRSNAAVVDVPRVARGVALAPLAQSGAARRRSSRVCGRGRMHVASPRAAILSPFGGADTDVKKRKERKKLRLRIDDVWYDCTGWAKAHPGGSIFIALMDGCDATDVFYALHSNGANGDDTAARRLAMLPTCLAPDAEGANGGAAFAVAAADAGVGHGGEREDTVVPLTTSPIPTPPPAPHTYHNKPGNANSAFATLRQKFENEGWFARNPVKEAAVLAQVLGLYGVGWFLANTHPVMAAISLGLGMQQAGWLAHDYIHGRGAWCAAMRGFGALTNGFSTEWWQNKHNMHHSFTNIDGRDGDIKLEPLYWLSDPAVTGRPDNKGLRKWQHLYGYPLYAMTYVLWRKHSVTSALTRKDKKEGLMLALHYAWLFICLPTPVALASVLLGGFLVGALVTATHQVP